MYNFNLSNGGYGYFRKKKFEPYDTQEMFKQGEEYVPRRKVLHEGIKAKFLENQHIAILIGGGSGVGKSSAIKKFVLPIFMKNFVLIDADEIKERLPEYKFFKKNNCLDASDYVHEESSDLAKMLIGEAIQNERSFIYDATMSKYEKYVDLIGELRKKDYNIHILFIDADVEVALERAAARFLNEDGSIGRYVSEDVVRETNINSANTFLRIINDVDGYTLINNDGVPIVIATERKVEKPDLYDLFKKKTEQL